MTATKSRPRPTTRKAQTNGQPQRTASTSEALENARAVLEVMTAVSAANTELEVAKAALDAVKNAFGWAYASYWKVDPKENSLRFAIESGSVNEEFRRVTMEARFREGEGLSGRAWRQRDLFFTPDIGQMTDCCRAPVAQRAGVKSGVCFPIVANNIVYGTMDFFSLETLTLSPERLDALRKVGFLVSMALTRFEGFRLAAMVESAPTNIMFADKDLRIQFVNPASVNQLKALEKFLPVKADQLVGQSIDIFHKNPAHQRKLLSDPNNLPHRTQIQVGPEILDLLVSPIRDQRGDYIGPMVTWEVVTEKQRLASETARVTSMMENAPINVLFADTDLKIRYMNPASAKQLKALEQLLPVRVEQIVGQSIDIFHKNPAHQRKMLADHKNLPHRAEIQLGADILDLLVSPIFGAGGEYLGPMVTWEVVTQRVNTERGVTASAQTLASSSEELTSVAQQMAASAEETATQANVVSAAAEEVSKNVQTVATGVEEMSASIREIAKNSNDAARVAEQAVKVAQTTNTTISKLGDSSAEIGKVIKVITSIAEQTNLLALNATIEAARAGEAGKGFAVVANEVKELAKETAKATEDIGQKIEAIQTDTRGAVQAIQEIGQIIGQINDITNTIASAVEEQTATTNEIARNVAEASKGSGEIAQNITSVAQAAQETTQGASSSQQAAAELSRMAAELQQLVSHTK